MKSIAAGKFKNICLKTLDDVAATIARALAQHDLWISLISLWEVAKKVEKKQLILDRPLDQWLDEAVTPQGAWASGS